MKRARPLIDNGDGTFTVTLTKGAVSIIDAQFAELVGSRNWCYLAATTGTGYAFRRSSHTPKRPPLYLHRQLIFWSGVSIEGLAIDHVNGRTLDNRQSNLRVCTPTENAHNRKLSSRNKSGVTGVSWMADRWAWDCSLMVDRTVVRLGYFKSFDEAVAARKAAEIKYYGEFVRAEEHR